MLSKLLQPEVTAFIKAHEKSDPTATGLDRLLFNKNKYPEIPVDLVVDQLKARQKAKSKLPLWFKTEGVIMPPLLSIEQSSSEEAAKYKAQFFKGGLAIDLTGGAGIDAYYLSQQFKKVIYIDFNKELAEIAKHNFNVLGATNITVLNKKSEEFIAGFNGCADLIYIDPARRDQNQKLFLFEDCSPNIVSFQSQLLLKSKISMVKASPMLDITKGITQLKNVGEVHIVAIKNEVKELLFIQSNTSKPIKITAIDLAHNNIFKCDWIQAAKANISEVSTYLYEPNAAILKSGKADALASKFNLCKLNANTQLFTSNNLEEGFPGRVFNVNQQLKYDKKEIRKNILSLKANIAARNFPDSVDEIRIKTGLKPGGDTYLFAVRGVENKIKILLCSKI